MTVEHHLAEGLLPARNVPGQDFPWTITERMARYHVPAVSVAVINDLQVHTAKAWGQLENGAPAPAKTSTPFQTASISKSVTAAGALSLVKEGLLNLDLDVTSYLPDGLAGEDYIEPVTLRHLLSHTGGMSVSGFAGYHENDQLPTLDQILAGQPPANSPAVERIESPGKRFRYSGGGYQVIQALMESVTGDSFPHIMQERVFGPLGMVNTSYAPLDDPTRVRAASGHLENGDVIPGKGPIHAESAAGGVWSTATDLARLMIAIMRAYRGEETPILPPKLAQTMLTPGLWDFGLGVRLQGEGENLRFNHGGATMGWHGQFIAYPSRAQGIALLTNSANGYLLWPEIERGVVQAFSWPGWEPEFVEPMDLLPEELAEYTGSYLLGGQAEVAVEARPGGIEIVYEGITWPAVPTEKDLFELVELVGQITCQRDSEGAITGFDLWFGMPDWSPYRKWHFEKIGSCMQE